MRRIEKGIFFVMTGIFMISCCLLPQTVSASEKKGSLTVYNHAVTREGIRAELSDVKFHLYKAGEKRRNEWKLQGVFEKASVNLKDMSSAGQRFAAERLYAFVLKEKPEGRSAVTDSNGKAFFSDLEEGLYLCASNPKQYGHQGNFHSAPFLVFIPGTDETGNSIYHVTVEPKNEWSEKNPEQGSGAPEKKEDASHAGNVKTGDPAAMRPFILLLLVSACVMAAAICRRRRCGRK